MYGSGELPLVVLFFALSPTSESGESPRRNDIWVFNVGKRTMMFYCCTLLLLCAKYLEEINEAKVENPRLVWMWRLDNEMPTNPQKNAEKKRLFLGWNMFCKLLKTSTKSFLLWEKDDTSPIVGKSIEFGKSTIVFPIFEASNQCRSLVVIRWCQISIAYYTIEKVITTFTD